MNPLAANVNTSDLALVNLSRKSCFSLKGNGRAMAALISGEGDILSYPKGSTVAGKSTFFYEEHGVQMQPDAIAFGTLAAQIAPATDDFFVDKDEFDLDHPTEGFTSIPEAIEDIRQGKVCCLLTLVNVLGHGCFVVQIINKFDLIL